jgi:hypothetical protein
MDACEGAADDMLEEAGEADDASPRLALAAS